MLSEKSKRQNDKDENSKEQFRCGRVRSSYEAVVMIVERRDSVIYTSEVKQLEMGGFYERRKVVQLKERMNECGLELHPEKTKIVYCQSDKNNGNHENQTFDFLGYTFRKRQVKSKYGEFFNGFTPAVSKSAAKSLRNKIKKERLFGNVLSLEGFAEAINPIIRGWANYFMKYSPSIAKKEIDYVNIAILLWIKRTSYEENK